MTEGDGPARLPMALVLACPACAGGFILALGAILGVTAIAVKSAILTAAALLVGGLWARNAWRRRDEA